MLRGPGRRRLLAAHGRGHQRLQPLWLLRHLHAGGAQERDGPLDLPRAQRQRLQEHHGPAAQVAERGRQAQRQGAGVRGRLPHGVLRQSPTAAAGLLPRLPGRATGAALVRVHRVLVAQRHGQAPRPQRHVRRRLALLCPGARRSSQGERSHGPRPARGARRGLRSQGQGPSGPGRHGVGRGVGQELRQSLRNVLRHGELAVPGVRVHAAHLPAHQGAPQDPGRGRAVGRRAGQLLQPLVRGAHGAHPVRVGQLHGRGVGGEPAARQILLLHLPEPHQAARRRRPAQDTGRPAAERGRAAAGPAHPGARLPESGEAALVQRGRRQPAQAVGGQHVVKRHVTIPDSLPSLPLQSWRRAAPCGTTTTKS